MRHNVHIACADCDQSAWRLSPKSDAGIHEAATAMSGAAQVGECRARALESGALDSWLSRERLLCGADFRSLKFRSWPADLRRSELRRLPHVEPSDIFAHLYRISTD